MVYIFFLIQEIKVKYLAMIQSLDFQNVVLGAAKLASPGNMLDVQISKPHPRATESESSFQQDPKEFHMHIKVREALV